MKKPYSMMFALQQLTSDLSKIERNHHILGSQRSENDIEHSFTVALLCWYVHDHLKLRLDLSKIFKYAIVHDFAERYAGDINTFASPGDRDRKVTLEAEAVNRLGAEFSEFGDLVVLLKSYEDKADEESVLVWTVDKMQALILADLDGWRPYKKLHLDYETFANKHAEQLAQCSSHCQEIFTALFEYCKSTYYDQPAAV